MWRRGETTWTPSSSSHELLACLLLVDVFLSSHAEVRELVFVDRLGSLGTALYARGVLSDDDVIRGLLDVLFHSRLGNGGGCCGPRRTADSRKSIVTRELIVDHELESESSTSEMAIECQSTRLRDQVLIDGNVFSRLLTITRFLDASKWRLGSRGVTYLGINVCLFWFGISGTYQCSCQSCQLQGFLEVSKFGRHSW